MQFEHISHDETTVNMSFCTRGGCTDAECTFYIQYVHVEWWRVYGGSEDCHTSVVTASNQTHHNHSEVSHIYEGFQAFAQQYPDLFRAIQPPLFGTTVAAVESDDPEWPVFFTLLGVVVVAVGVGIMQCAAQSRPSQRSLKSQTTLHWM